VAQGVYPWSDEAMVALYQKLFVTHAALCELYFEFEVRGTHALCVTAVSVYVLEVDSGSGEVVNLPAEGMRSPNVDFYMDEGNFTNITADQVGALLDGFWKQFGAYMQEDEAFAVLGLPVSSSAADIRQRFRELASRYHPDRGGDPQRFIEVRRAYESLKNRY